MNKNLLFAIIIAELQVFIFASTTTTTTSSSVPRPTPPPVPVPGVWQVETVPILQPETAQSLQTTSSEANKKSGNTASSQNSAKMSGTNNSTSSNSSLSSVTAQYLASLGMNGDSSVLNSLLANGDSSGVKNNQTTNIILEQLLKQLQEKNSTEVNSVNTKEATNKVSTTDKTNATNNANTTKTTSINEGQLVRLKINGNDILSKCSIVFSSGIAKDGSFLITGDRVYLSDKGESQETFYMFFKKNTSKQYEMAVQVYQPVKNDYSYLAILSHRGVIPVKQIGNMLVFLNSDNTLNADILVKIPMNN